MRSLLSTMAVVAVALALSGCHDHPQQPLPGPKSPSPTTSGRTAASRMPAAGDAVQQRASPDEINWFQGTLEEAFTRRPRTDDRPRFR
jgi:hypothetical protein